MKTRKLILSALVVALLCIYIVQLIIASRSPIKTFDLKAGDADSVNQITIVSAANGSVVLNKAGDSWTVSEDAYKTDVSLITDIVDGITHVRTLGTVSSSSSEETLQRFGLDNNTAITVTALKPASGDGQGAKAVRTLYIGKAATTGDQTYVRMDGKSDIYLASGSLRDVFGVTTDSVRSKSIYALSSEELTGVSVNGKNGAFTAHKALGENGAVWTIEGGAVKEDGTPQADSAKIGSWANQLVNLSAQSWADKGTVMPAETDATVELTCGTTRVSVTVAKIENGDETKYLCSSSETPYLFYVTKTVADRLTKAVSDFN